MLKKFGIKYETVWIILYLVTNGCAASALEIPVEGRAIMNKKISVTLSARDLDGALIVKVKFVNEGRDPILVMEGTNGFGRRGASFDKPTPVMDDEYLVRCDGKFVPYVGPIYKRKPYTIEYFSDIQPGEIIEEKYDRLDSSYNFPFGTHECEIVHRHYEYDKSNNLITRHNSNPVKIFYTRK